MTLPSDNAPREGASATARSLAWAPFRSPDLAELREEFGGGCRPPGRSQLATLLKLAGSAKVVVELGTAQGWTAMSLALAQPEREVTRYDPFERHDPQRYLGARAGEGAPGVTLLLERGDKGPPTNRPVDLLYTDSTDEQADSFRELEAWWPALRPAAWVVLDDFVDPAFPGVIEAVSELRLDGEDRDGLFIHRVTRWAH